MPESGPTSELTCGYPKPLVATFATIQHNDVFLLNPKPCFYPHHNSRARARSHGRLPYLILLFVAIGSFRKSCLQASTVVLLINSNSEPTRSPFRMRREESESFLSFQPSRNISRTLHARHAVGADCSNMSSALRHWQLPFHHLPC